MARKPGLGNGKTIIVVDTSYLLELFGVPGFSDDRGHKEVKKRFGVAPEHHHRVFVPVPCLIQTAHILKRLSSPTKSTELAGKVLDSIERSLKTGGPWVLTPAPCLDFLEQFRAAWREFTDTGNHFEFVDSFVALEAARLKSKHAGLAYSVHIWTKDGKLKAREPDEEQEPFVV